MKRTILALLFACSYSDAADCVAIADGLAAAADAGRRGVDVSTILNATDSANSSETTNVGIRLLFLEAFRRGAAGEAVDELWLDFYGRCKNTTKEERPS